MKPKETVYTYFKIVFKNCGLDYDYTIVETLSDALQYLESVETDLDDPEAKAKVIITGIGMTEKQWNEWVKVVEP